MTLADTSTRGISSPIEPVLVEFAAGLAHDLSNALNSVGLHADMAKLMLDRGEIDNARRMLDGVQAEFRRNIHLMNALRRFASAPNTLHTAPVALSALLGEARECACLLIDAEPTAIVISQAPAIVAIDVDRDAMVHVIVQIIRNAIEAGATRVTLEADGDDDHWRLAIRDNGPGIDAVMRPKLFHMFASTRREQGHLGLGLWVVDRLCSAHGLRVDAQPCVDGGTRFLIENASTR